MPSAFYVYFKENMEALGLLAPESLFGTLQAAVTNAQILMTQIDKFGKSVTIGEILGAGTNTEILGAIAAVSAAYYVGAVLGSIAVATGRSLSNGTSLSDVLISANNNNLGRPWLVHFYQCYPGIFDCKVPRAQRSAYRYQGAFA